jgi:hypothetical protein
MKKEAARAHRHGTPKKRVQSSEVGKQHVDGPVLWYESYYGRQ